MTAMASQITSPMIVYSTVYSRRRSKKTSKLRVAGLYEGNSPVTGEFFAQRASNAGNHCIWWHHHGFIPLTNGKCCAEFMLSLFLTWTNCWITKRVAGDSTHIIVNMTSLWCHNKRKQENVSKYDAIQNGNRYFARTENWFFSWH